MYTQKNNQLLLIQVLRGVASFMVVLFHATENFRLNFDGEFLSGFFSFGAAGVDLFFVLSGFIITYTSSSLVGQPSNVSYFLKRRIIRIFPVYWIIIAGFLCVQLILPSFYKNGYSFTGLNLIRTFLLLPGHSMVNGVSWTLTNELFFYVLFITAFLIRSRALLYSIATGYCLLLLAVFFSGQFMLLSNEWLQLILSPQNLEFFMGILAALVFRRIPGKMALPMAITGSALFLLAGILENSGIVPFDQVFNRVVYFGLPSFVLIVGVAVYEIKSLPLMPNRLLVSIGNASYSLYLLHLPLLVAAMRMIARFSGNSSTPAHLFVSVAIIAICGFSILFFNLVENPLTRFLNGRLKTSRTAKLKVEQLT